MMSKVLAIGVTSTVLIILLLVLAIIGEDERSGGDEAVAGPPATASTTKDAIRLELSLLPGHAKVSEMVTIAGKLVDTNTGERIKDVQFDLVSLHVEDNLSVFEATVASIDGTFSWGVQFWDGAEHELRITARPALRASGQFGLIELKHLVEVEGIAPPLWVQIRATLYLVAVAAVGLVIGIPLGSRIRGSLARPRQPAQRPT